MNILKKLTVSLIIIPILISCGQTSVSANTLNRTESTKELFSKFPKLQQELNENGYTELVGTYDQYFKVELKDENSKKINYEISDFNLIPESKEEFELAQLKKSMSSRISTRSAQDFYNGIGGDDHLMLSLSAYRNVNLPYKFAVTHSYAWTSKPVMNFKDAIGISVSSTMKINADTYSSQSAYNTIIVDSTSPTGVSNHTDVVDNTEFKHNNVGVATKFDLKMGYTSEPGYPSEQFGYIKAEAQFTQTGSNLGHQSANIFGNYIHTKVGWDGTLSIGIDGKPSIGLHLYDEEFSHAIDVEYN